jgi:hypothetical protein
VQLHQRFGWHLVGDEKDVKVDVLAGQHLSPMRLRNLDQLRAGSMLQPGSQSGSSTRRSRSMVRRAGARFLTGVTNRSIRIGGRPGPVSTIVLTAQGYAASDLGSPVRRIRAVVPSEENNFVAVLEDLATLVTDQGVVTGDEYARLV